VVSNNQSIDFDGRPLVVEDRRQGRAIVGVEHQIIKKLLDFRGRRVNRVIIEVEEQAFLFWVCGRGLGTLLSLKVVGDGKVEDRAQKGFLVASHKEAVEEGTDLFINSIGFRVQPVEPVDHAENEASQHARRMGAVRR
jgi:hypothetical protein